MENKFIAITSDHAGYELKEVLTDHLEEKGWKVEDTGNVKFDPEDDYPDYAHKLARFVESQNIKGISLCGAGNGISIAANKHNGIRSAICWNEEVADLAVRHNDANICSLPARFLNEEDAKKIVDTFLEASFEGGRHERRIKKIPVK